jgi:hypothetical protein
MASRKKDVAGKSAAERQRQRRARLTGAGHVPVSMFVPGGVLARFDAYAKRLGSNRAAVMLDVLAKWRPDKPKTPRQAQPVVASAATHVVELASALGAAAVGGREALVRIHAVLGRLTKVLPLETAERRSVSAALRVAQRSIAAAPEQPEIPTLTVEEEAARLRQRARQEKIANPMPVFDDYVRARKPHKYKADYAAWERECLASVAFVQAAAALEEYVANTSGTADMSRSPSGSTRPL